MPNDKPSGKALDGPLQISVWLVLGAEGQRDGVWSSFCGLQRQVKEQGGVWPRWSKGEESEFESSPSHSTSGSASAGTR